MKTSLPLTRCACALACTALAGAVQAGPGKTQQQAQDELNAALRAGTVVTDFQGLSPRQLHPELYPTAVPVPGKTDAQARAELDAALRAGTVVTSFQGLSPRQLHPELYPPAPAVASKTRAQVEDELARAMAGGNVAVDFQGLTPRQLAHGAYEAPGNAMPPLGNLAHGASGAM